MSLKLRTRFLPIGVALFLVVGAVLSTDAGDPVCGDGVLDFATEACDDGNNISGDGCEADCHLLRYVSLSGSDTTGDGSRGAPYRTIQHAFEQASSFYTIMVGPGTYNECVTAGPPLAADRPVSIIAEAWVNDRDNSATVISGDGVCDRNQLTLDRDAVVDIRSRGSRLQGFTIQDGGNSAIIGGGSVAITHNVITDSSSSRAGGGIYLNLSTNDFGAVQSEVRGNVIRGNEAAGDGGGLWVSAAAVDADVDVIIDGNTIDNNTIDSEGNVHGGGLGVFTNSTTGGAIQVAVTNNVISDNRTATGTSGYSGGAWIYTFGLGTENVDITGNTIENNTAELDGGGLSVWISTEGSRADPFTADSDIRHTVNVANNVVRNNTAANGGGLDLFVFAQNLRDDERGQINATDNLISDNESLGDGGFGGGGGGALAALTSWRSATPETWIRLEGNTLQSNVTGISGGGVGIVIEADANPPGDTTVPLPEPAFAAGRVDVVRNLITENDASADFAGGGGVFAYLKSFVDAATTLNAQRNTIAGNLADYGAGGIHLETYTADDPVPTGGSFVADAFMSNNIVDANGGVGVGGPIPGVEFGILSPDSSDNEGNLTLDIRYNDVFGHPNGNYDIWFPDPTGQNGNISADPMFDSAWREDACSPTINAADPALDFSLEPLPNGARANMGFTGGTPDAVISLPDVSGDAAIDGLDILKLSVAFGASTGAPRYDLAADVNGDGIVDGADLMLVASDFGAACP